MQAKHATKNGRTKNRARGYRVDPIAQSYDLGAKPSRVTVETVADPEAPNRTITRGRIVPLYDIAWRKGWLSDDRREAADKWAILRERAAGARDGGAQAAGVTAPWRRVPASEAQLIALGEVRRAREAMGEHGEALLIAWIEQGQAVEVIAAQLTSNPRRVMREIKAALAALVALWGMA